MSFDNPEEMETIIEEAIRVAATCPDTPMDGGFGYDFEGETATAELVVTRGKPTGVQGFRLPGVDIEDIDRVTSLNVVPYAGDEKPIPRVVRQIDPFMRDLPA
ncbi:MAG TPA: hypothetical protein VHA05_03100 [Candidatus Saccharimonadales bacterium]|nr:hypothetical protein [Candidatus Saccharimonadales bacterium]